VAEPVVEVAEPVVSSVTEPVAQVAEPVVEAVAPVTDPVVDVVEPVVDPVVEAVTPVTDPVTDAVRPVVEAVVPTPVADPILEPAPTGVIDAVTTQGPDASSSLLEVPAVDIPALDVAGLGAAGQATVDVDEPTAAALTVSAPVTTDFQRRITSVDATTEPDGEFTVGPLDTQFGQSRPAAPTGAGLGSTAGTAVGCGASAGSGGGSGGAGSAGAAQLPAGVVQHYGAGIRPAATDPTALPTRAYEPGFSPD